MNVIGYINWIRKLNKSQTLHGTVELLDVFCSHHNKTSWIHIFFSTLKKTNGPLRRVSISWRKVKTYLINDPDISMHCSPGHFLVSPTTFLQHWKFRPDLLAALWRLTFRGLASSIICVTALGGSIGLKGASSVPEGGCSFTLMDCPSHKYKREVMTVMNHSITPIYYSSSTF